MEKIIFNLHVYCRGARIGLSILATSARISQGYQVGRIIKEAGPRFGFTVQFSAQFYRC